VPRWLNAETFDPLRIEPKQGKVGCIAKCFGVYGVYACTVTHLLVVSQAVLIYAQLPDGNRDELAEFGSEVVRNGDKWILQLTIRE
jgi:hypothetical protein